MSNYAFTSLQEWFPEYSVIPLWADSRNSADIQAQFTSNNPPEQPLEREISKVSNPEIMVVTPTEPNGVGILIIPGGSYKRVAFDKEGVDTALVLSNKGYTVFIMTYRMPADGHNEGNYASLADAQRAVRVIRSQSERWSVRSLGIMGFSAGGHVASSLATRFDYPAYSSQDQSDFLSARPDFVCLMYPVITMEHTIGHPGSRNELLGNSPTPEQLSEFSNEKQIDVKTPPCFIVHACDDPAVKVENSIVFWQALKKHHIPAELHLFETGGHGSGIKDTIGLPAGNWPHLCDKWIQVRFQ